MAFSRGGDGRTNLYGAVDPQLNFAAGVNQCLNSRGINMRPDKIHVEKNATPEWAVEWTYTPDKSRMTARSFGFARFAA